MYTYMYMYTYIHIHMHTYNYLHNLYVGLVDSRGREY